jgi:hypothetical protein
VDPEVSPRAKDQYQRPGMPGYKAHADRERLRVYLAHPGNQLQAYVAEGMAVLVSYANHYDWIDKWIPTFGRVLIDSGAYSVLNSKRTIDVRAYTEWAAERYARGDVDAYAGLDDIAGDWRQSLKNYRYGGFPTMHDTDPPELLDDLIPIARAQGGWIGLGLQPPRHRKEAFVRSVLERLPDDLHVHGWALRAYAHLRRLDSVDSTNWWRDAMALRTKMPWLTFGECQELMVKRYQRWTRLPAEEQANDKTKRQWVVSAIEDDGPESRVE